MNQLCTLLVFIFCTFSTIYLSAQCTGLVTSSVINTTLTGRSSVGQSWVADCNGVINSITVRSNATANTLNNVTLRIWEEVPGTGIQVIYIQPGVSLNGRDVATTVFLLGGTGSPEMTLGSVYYFTLTRNNGQSLDLQAGNAGTYIPGFAVDGNLAIINANTDLFFSVSATVSLPVELNNFEVQQQIKGVQLTWTTGSEINNHGFFIEKSLNGEIWKTLDFINGAGFSNQINNYHYDDATASAGHHYYRLRQEDFDGKYTYSEIRSIYLTDHNHFAIHPNPVRNWVAVYLPENVDQLNIFDQSGGLVQTIQIQNDDRWEGSLNHLPAGFYYIQTDRGETKKFIKIN